ncbi:MAG TPA: tetratricopeptide repeat protein [Armatimonadetes bacterium]|jgi:tetratricopeptide (TPR) repeat protein|nr:tetratricopeptide repeat protein [Armatimonadota bacterium]
MEHSPPPTGGSNLALAIEALESGQAEQAIQLLQFATAMNPNSGEAHFHLGRAYAARDNLTLAEASLRRAVELLPGDAPALCALGKLLARQQSHEEARRVLEACLEANAQCQEAREALELLPRPEDRAIPLPDLEMASARLDLANDTGAHTRRLLLITAGLGLLLAFFLAFAFLQMQKMLSTHASGTAASQAETSWSAPRDGAPAGHEKSPTPDGAASAEDEPGSAAADCLRRLYEAQREYHARHGRYASLTELAEQGVVEEGCATGEPVAAYGNAVFSEEPPTRRAFAIRAALPGGETLVMDQEGQLRRE